MRIEEGWLVRDDGDPPVIWVVSPKSSALEVPEPLGCAWHNTGPIGDDPVAFCSRSASSATQASWHVLVTRDGRLIQGIPFTRGSWHVGRSGLVRGATRSINACLVGIELENLGRLKLVGGSWRYFVPGADPWRGNVPESSVVLVSGEGSFHDYPPRQRAAAASLLQGLVDS